MGTHGVFIIKYGHGKTHFPTLLDWGPRFCYDMDDKPSLLRQYTSILFPPDWTK